MATAPVSTADGTPLAVTQASAKRGLAFLLLGPLEVWIKGSQLEVRQRKQRQLLTLLLLRPGEVVSVDRLIADLWNESAPKAALGSLQNLVWGLRKLLGTEVVRTRASGYSLEVEPDCIDLHRFQRVVAEGHNQETAESRAERLREALSLWRGPALADFACEPFAQVEIARLEEVRVAAQEELVDAELELGHHRTLVSELEALVAEHPLRERLRGQLMLALYRSRRQTEALAEYQAARHTLRNELGLEPSEELRRLQRAILTHDPSLESDGPAGDAAGNGMEFRLLGPVEARADGEPLRLGKTKQRALLAFLLLHANRVVSREQLTYALWGEEPPETAATALHGYVSGLRKVLGADRIETRPPGYVLHAAPGEIDLEVFERLYGQARALEPKAAAEQLGQALAQWRGVPLADLDGVAFVPVERVRLEELHLGAIEDRADAELALGRDVELIGELQARVQQHPLRERLRAQLMLALYRSGRQTEALEVYRHGRRRLAEELGLEPGETLKRLERAILEQDPALNLRPSLAGRPESVTGPPRPRWRRLIAAVAAMIVVAGAAGVLVALTRGSARVTVVPNSVAIINPQTNRIVGNVVVGRRPVALALGQGDVWVANADDGTISRIDAERRKVVDVIRVGTDVRDVTTGFGAIWVADGKDGSVTRIDPHRSTVTTLRFAGRGHATPTVDWVATGAGVVWASRGDNTLLEIDPVTNKVAAQTNIPRPTGLAAGLGAAWVTTDDHRLLRVVPGKSARPKLTVKARLTDRGVAPTAGAGSVWAIVYHGTGQIWRIEPDSGVARIIPSVGRYPLDLAVDDRSENAWAVDVTGAVVRVNPNIDLAVTGVQTAPTNRSAIAVGAGAVWVAVQE